MSKFIDALGVIGTSLQIGLTNGLKILNTAGKLQVRNASNSADAELIVSKLNNSGDSILLNSDATATGSDYSVQLQRAVTGMSGNYTLTLPPTSGATGQVLQTDGSPGNLVWVTPSSGSSSVSTDTTTINFGSTSPVSAFTLPINGVIQAVRVLIDTAFDGTPSLSVGISGNLSKYFSSNQVDLSQATIFETYPKLTSSGTTEAIIITYSAGGATAGTARIEVDYVVPS